MNKLRLAILGFLYFITFQSVNAQEFSSLDFSFSTGKTYLNSDLYSENWYIKSNYELAVFTPFYIGNIGLSYHKFAYYTFNNEADINAQHYIAWFKYQISFNAYFYLLLGVGTGILKTYLLDERFEYNPEERELSLNYSIQISARYSRVSILYHSTVFNYYRQYNLNSSVGISYSLPLPRVVTELVK